MNESADDYAEPMSDRGESAPRFRELAAEALKYWETRRVVYNIVLAGVVIFYFVLAWPGSKGLFSVNAVLFSFHPRCRSEHLLLGCIRGRPFRAAFQSSCSLAAKALVASFY